jgi:hypothetical protein
MAIFVTSSHKNRLASSMPQVGSDAKQQTEHKKIRAASCSGLGLTAIRKKKSRKDCSTKSSTLVALKNLIYFRSFLSWTVTPRLLLPKRNLLDLVVEALIFAWSGAQMHKSSHFRTVAHFTFSALVKVGPR